MFWGRKQQPANRPLLVLDIGTTYVKAAVFYVADNQVRLVGFGRAKHQSDSMRGGMVVDLPSVVASCNAAIEVALGEMTTLPTSVILGVSGQLTEGIATTVHYDRAHPDQPLEHSELKNIIYKIQHRSSEKLRASLSEKFAEDHPDVELIHASVVDVQLDGYTVESPVGFQGKRLTLTIFNAYIPSVYVSILQNLARELALEIVSIASQPYGLSKLFANPEANAAEQDGILIDVGGMTTDIVVVRQGNIEGIQSFAMGGQAFTNRIQQESGGTWDKAEKTKLAYIDGSLDRRLAKKLEPILLDEAKLWLDGVELALKEFSELKILPSRIFLAGGGATLPEVRRMLLTKSWAEQLPFTKKPYPALAVPTDLWGVVDEIGSELPSQDLPTLALTKLALQMTPPNDLVTAALQSIVRSMKENK